MYFLFTIASTHVTYRLSCFLFRINRFSQCFCPDQTFSYFLSRQCLCVENWIVWRSVGICKPHGDMKEQVVQRRNSQTKQSTPLWSVHNFDCPFLCRWSYNKFMIASIIISIAVFYDRFFMIDNHSLLLMIGIIHMWCATANLYDFELTVHR